jgi:tripartite-type tricarboxylate transporter receptor subunit TctC
MMHHQKLTELNPTSYTPIALVNLDPAGVQVRADSPYKNGRRAGRHQGAPRASSRPRAPARAASGTWRLAGWLRDAKVDPANVPWVPSNGAAPGLQDLVAGGIEFAPVSLPEARSLIDAGKVQVAGGDGHKRSALFPNVPTLKEATGSDWATGAWRGIAAPKGLPADMAPAGSQRQEGLRQQGIQGLHGQRGFGLLWGRARSSRPSWPRVTPT